jgi:aminopeptidase N
MNKSILWFALIFLFSISCKTTSPRKDAATQSNKVQNQSAIGEYRSSYPKYFDLIHTKLRVKPDWSLRELAGEASISLKPHFYPNDKLILNARGMEIHSVQLEHVEENLTLAFHYANNLLEITLDKEYKRNDTLTVLIEYTSRPELLPEGGSAAIRKDKGLYFINPDGTNPFKPKQLWTQGETESNSVWFPTIEDPGQRMTQEIYFTIDSSLKTLSNGLLLSSVNNPDGTRTDYWKQDQALAPYLTMIAAGDFAVVRDRWRDKEVSYYIDKEYEKYAKMIFGKTPEMLEFYSSIFGYDYPWDKYNQVVVHEFVSGAMENNTAVVHGTNMLQDPREHDDHNYEDIISHEVTHHWFGNLLTCESWANVTLNEGFASYGEYLWFEYKYGRERADEFGKQDQNTYLRATKKSDAPLVRFQYENREDVYDAISYQKGARVLHMLRKSVGDEAFFESLKKYVQTYKYTSVEYEQLRMVFEDVIGEDLNWFFDQWFLKSGKPSLDIATSWDDTRQELRITLSQTQDLKKNPVFRLAMDVDFYFNSKTERKRIILDSLQQSFTFTFPEEPKLVNVDAEKMLLLNSKNDKKSIEKWIYQYEHAPLFLDRYEAIDAIGKVYRTGTPEAETIMAALTDKQPAIRLLALGHIKELAVNSSPKVKDKIIGLAETDSNSYVRATAYEALSRFYPYKDLDSIFEKAIPDYSYVVEATVFEIISSKDPEKAIVLTEILEKDSSNVVLSQLASFYSEHPEMDKADFYRKALFKSNSWSQYRIIGYYTGWLKGQKTSSIKQGTELLTEIGLNSNNKHIRVNCAASLIRILNELDERTTELKRTIAKKEFNKKTEVLVSSDEVDLMQIESLKKDIEKNIKVLEEKS